MFTPIESSSSIIPTSSSNSVIQPPCASNIQDAKKISKVRARKRKKELLKKMNDAVIEIKMAQHRPRKPASVEYTTDEEDMIVYDMGEEIESPKNGKSEKNFNDDHREEITDFVQSIPGFQECDEDVETPGWHAVRKTVDFKC
ncbi:glycerol-3-phosphate dehydrogenase [Trichonephila clavipes]|uniref:Glycerol-3-phosphate dehydrogenase n=1 Tax=Trichonephila clavipes TaxID=2585209 RepID=A0A8X6SD89_TRICX|nr:glycerol-3-phosphate dehydrogenase [Trichonephila clavipes]